MSNENSTTNRPSGKVSKCKELVLYPDDPIHSEIIVSLISDRRAVGILHDKDSNDDGSLKKPHYHFIIKFEQGATEGTVLKLFPDLKTQYIQYVKSERGAMRYLIHIDNPEKFQYQISDIVGNKSLALRYLQSDDFESDGIRKILSYLADSRSEIVSTSDLMLWCCSQNLYSVFRRSSYILSKVLDEHNKDVSKYWCIELIERAEECKTNVDEVHNLYKKSNK